MKLYFRSLKFMFLMVLLGSLAVSCKKTEDAQPTKMDLLTGTSTSGKKWKQIKILENGRDLTGFSTCGLDEVHTFFRDGKYNINFGTVKCAPNSPDNIDWKWAFATNETEITLFYGQPFTYKVITLTATTLQISGTNSSVTSELTYQAIQ